MLHLAIMLEEGNLIDRCLNAQDETELIIHFDGERSHLMLDARAEPTLIEAITHLALVVAIQLAAEESGNVCNFPPTYQAELISALCGTFSYSKWAWMSCIPDGYCGGFCGTSTLKLGLSQTFWSGYVTEV